MSAQGLFLSGQGGCEEDIAGTTNVVDAEKKLDVGGGSIVSMVLVALRSSCRSWRQKLDLMVVHQMLHVWSIVFNWPHPKTARYSAEHKRNR